SDLVDAYISVIDDTSPMTHLSVTAASEGSLAIVFGGSYLSETGSYTFGNGFTQRYGSTSNPAMWIGTKEVGAGAIGDTDVTNSSTLIRGGAYTLVLSPSASSGSSISNELQLNWDQLQLVTNESSITWRLLNIVSAQS